MIAKDVIFSNTGFRDDITHEQIFCHYCKKLIAKFKIGRTFCCSESKIKCSYFQNLVEKAEQRKEKNLFTTKGLEDSGVPKNYLKIWGILGHPNCEICNKNSILQVEVEGTLPHLLCINNPKNISIFNKDNWLVVCSLCYLKIKYEGIELEKFSKDELRKLLKEVKKENLELISKNF